MKEKGVMAERKVKEMDRRSASDVERETKNENEGKHRDKY